MLCSHPGLLGFSVELGTSVAKKVPLTPVGSRNPIPGVHIPDPLFAMGPHGAGEWPRGSSTPIFSHAHQLVKGREDKLKSQSYVFACTSEFSSHLLIPLSKQGPILAGHCLLDPRGKSSRLATPLSGLEQEKHELSQLPASSRHNSTPQGIGTWLRALLPTLPHCPAMQLLNQGRLPLPTLHSH